MINKDGKFVYYNVNDPAEAFYHEHYNDPDMTPEKMDEEIAKITKAEIEREMMLKAKRARKADFFWKMGLLRKFGGLPEKFLIYPIVDKDYKPMFPEKAEEWLNGKKS